MRRLALALLFCAVVALGACRRKAPALDGVPYRSAFGDFECLVPKGWEAETASDRGVYRFTTWVGPDDPQALWGAPRFVLTWHAAGKEFTTASGSRSRFDSIDDYLRQMGDGAWGPEPSYPEPRHAVTVAGRPGERLAVRVQKDAYLALPGARPVSQGGPRMWRRDTAALVPTRGGFYTIVFPCAEVGYERYAPAFEKLLASLRFLKDNPAGL